MAVSVICQLVILLSSCMSAPSPTASSTMATKSPGPTTTAKMAAVALPTVTPTLQSEASSMPTTPMRLLLTNSSGNEITRLDPATGSYEQLEVGTAPWGVALSPDRAMAYVATAEGVTIVDLTTWQQIARVPYAAAVGAPQFGEYRPGGMGIAVAPDGSEVYVGVYLGSEASRLEILDTAQQSITESFVVGLRPFQVLVSADGQHIYSIDHDSFTVTALDLATRTVRTLAATPLGSLSLASFDKPHYAVLDSRGHLLLPYQGQVLLDLDPNSGEATTRPLTANTHQHGIAWTPDRTTLLIVGTGPAGSATGAANLTIYEWATATERFVPLARAHEHVAVSPDGRWAYLTGGHSFANGGWDGITVVDLIDLTLREITIPNRPLDIVIVP